MKRLLLQLARYGDISWLSYHFAEFIANQEQVDENHLLSLTAALICEAQRNGNVCIDLNELAAKPLFAGSGVAPENLPVADSTADWRAQLETFSCVGEPTQRTPITLEGDRVYLNRYWHYENSVAGRIRQKLVSSGANGTASTTTESLHAISEDLDDDQKNAVVTAVTRLFCVVSGGPGSGKTSTVVRIIQALLASDRHCRIALTAPTGKAAARLVESIRQRVDNDDPGGQITASASTIHRLLRFRRGGFEHDAANPLPVDCVIVDEASMIDLKLMYYLLEALPEEARLILLGDRDQLASVAAGNVLGDITGHGFGLGNNDLPIVAAIALLRQNYRFDQSSAIGDLAQLVNSGNVEQALFLLQRNERGLSWFQTVGDQVHGEIMQRILEDYRKVYRAKSPQTALDIYDSCRVLCATNDGPFGIDTLNRDISSALLAIDNEVYSERFHGLPIMITRNRHDLELYNGDTGILWQSATGLRAWFRDSETKLRDFSVNRLPEFAPAWASTVHKSQGSEFDRVVMFLPLEIDSEVLTRELLYTAITRARRQFILHASGDSVATAIGRLTRRHSGLSKKLGWPD